MIIILDAGPLGLISNPKASVENEACRSWMKELSAAGHTIAVPEICDYEVRRELLRAEKSRGIERLNTIKLVSEYIALNSETMLKQRSFGLSRVSQVNRLLIILGSTLM